MGASCDLHYTTESITYLLSFVSCFALCVQNTLVKSGGRQATTKTQQNLSLFLLEQ